MTDDRQKFEEQFGNRGGVKTLEHMALVELFTTKYMADHFGIAEPQMQIWIDRLIGKDYNVREKRKEKIINTMLKYASEHSLEEFREAYYYISQHYFNIALSEAYSRGIYKDKI